MIYHVYKLRVVNTGFFYFGITTDLERRRTTHYSRINSFVKQLIVIPARNRPENTGHAAVANAFIKGKRSLNNKDCFPKRLCVIKSLHEFENVADAVLHETRYIQKNKNNPKCFNTEKESRYYQRKAKNSASC